MNMPAVLASADIFTIASSCIAAPHVKLLIIPVMAKQGSQTYLMSHQLQVQVRQVQQGDHSDTGRH